MGYHIALVFLDDFKIFDRKFEDYLDSLELKLCRPKEAVLKIKGSKMYILSKEFFFSWTYCVKKRRRSLSGKDKRSETHQRSSQYQTTAGVIRIHWVLPRFIEGFGKTEEPLYKFPNNSEKFFLNEGCKAVKELKEELQQSPKRRYPEDEDMHTQTTVASLTGIGATLTQKQQDQIRIIAYASKTQWTTKLHRNQNKTIRNRKFCALFPKLSVGT